MKLVQDAYGQEIWAYFKGGESFEIVERDDGYFGVSSGDEVPVIGGFNKEVLNNRKIEECNR